MSIKRMLLLASMSLAAIAFAAPAVAQANVTLTDPENVPLKKGAAVTATSTNLQTHLADGSTLTCELVTLHLKVLTNNGSQVTVDTGQVTTKNCVAHVGPNTLPATITNPKLLGNLTINTAGHGEVESTFISDVFEDLKHEKLVSQCHFVGGVTVQATASGGSNLNIPGSTLNSETCPPGVITGDFTLETSDTTPVTIDFTP